MKKREAADAPPPSPSARPASATTDAEVVSLINAAILQGWKDAGIAPSQPATDGEWCRRVFLDILGRVPTVEELQGFLAEKSTSKRQALVDRLLESDRYVEEYARNWTTIWTNILIGRPPAQRDRRRLVNREGMQQWLRRSLLKNKSYDAMVYELVSATGSSKPGEEGYNGAVNFLLDNLQENAATATAKTARYFLGLQVQCTQCHNHPFNEWKQNQFWELNAFFRQTKALRTFQGRNDIAFARLENEDFAGESRKNPKEAEIYYELRNGTIAAAWPTFVDGTKIDASGYSDEVNRRAELARLITKSEYLGKAIVNRMWAHFLGHGFTRPIDDLGPHNPPSHPELLDRLGQEFAGTGHDLKRLIRWVALSEPYSLSSKVGPKNKRDDPALGEKPLFSHFYLRQMRAEELYESLLVATEADKTKGGYEEQEKTKGDWLRQFTIAFGTDEGDDATTFDGTIPQTLMLMNGDLVQKATKAEPGSFLHRVAASNLKAAAQIDFLYMAALARKPSGPELKMANDILAARGGDTAAALQDVWWALLNSNEFILNH
ncbi:MAG: DUF1549 domain-containing protein [Planctomycetia bacterium]|nr:DUF1549 domain-containing protein [Planctomycetia bacterium]